MSLVEQIKANPATLIEKIISGISSEKFFEVRFDDADDDDVWAFVTVHIYQDDQELSLRLHASDEYDLHLGYYDDNDEFLELTHTLTPDQKLLVPERLRKLLKKVILETKGLRVPGDFLSK